MGAGRGLSPAGTQDSQFPSGHATCSLAACCVAARSLQPCTPYPCLAQPDPCKHAALQPPSLHLQPAAPSARVGGIGRRPGIAATCIAATSIDRRQTSPGPVCSLRTGAPTVTTETSGFHNVAVGPPGPGGSSYVRRGGRPICPLSDRPKWETSSATLRVSRRKWAALNSRL